MRRTSIGLRTVVAFSALALALSPVLTLEAGASGGGSGGSTSLVPVAQGFSPASIPGATVFGTTPSSTPEQVSFILNERNEQQLEYSVESGVRYDLSVSQFAQYYGQSQYNINELTTYLSKFGITSDVYPDDVDVSTSGTAGQYDAALSVQQNQYHAPGFFGHNGTWNVPASPSTSTRA